MRRLRRTKIIATLGPATVDKAVIAGLVRAGADVFRINMSHTDHAALANYVRVIREIEAEMSQAIGILVDLQGPKLRIGAFEEGSVHLRKGDVFILDSDPTPGDVTRVRLPHPEILAALKVGDTVLIDDGRVRMHVVEAAPDRAHAVVDVAGRLSNRKGVSLPDTEIPITSMTTKDRADLDAALEQGIDWVAISFVQRAEDVVEVKRITKGRALVMAKIEKPQAIHRLDEVIEVSDALMVARGDLGVEVPLERVPGLQKRINRSARRLGKPVVIATQMLESMILSPLPTRAEVSDVATAVFEGADAVMLSAESAAGQYPQDAVATMSRIAEEVETDAVFRSIINAQRGELANPTYADAIAVAARDVAQTLHSKAICAWTSSGTTALRIARERPQSPILALTPKRDTARRLALVWGVHALETRDATDIEDMVKRACEYSKSEGFGEDGDRVIIVAGMPFGSPGATNMIRIAHISDEDGMGGDAP
ncbi:pyruvate kinase [Methylocystis sp. MJC1]|jgi:pyruvate kinase|uniref:pyruvate kinase n=1 Tax=Methylocystis sp. MJC1 TaxID=2654282 RepID=UPI0013E9B197|nr:pyruvate kinase [Methylocystis sp. MJC1]KAF2991750.1 Pyruvate kinase [Methylocystis sp. MJC1]MBU6527011.1 pyruvate kinase [Methylocystis sp. MJC1]UZX13449.1 pyruvate kinase [Methylocystis sp. MJC1]